MPDAELCLICGDDRRRIDPRKTNIETSVGSTIIETSIMGYEFSSVYCVPRFGSLSVLSLSVYDSVKPPA